MTTKLYIPDPPIHDSLVDEQKKATERFQSWLIVLQGNVNPILSGFSANIFNTVAGSSTQTISAPGITASSIVFVNINKTGVSQRTVLSATPVTDAITVQMSGDPGADHVLSWLAVSLPT